MSLEIPVSFVLDPERNITGALLEDAPSALIELQEEFALTQFGRTVHMAAELLVTRSEPMARKYQTDAFYSGAAVAGASFAQADIDEHLKTRTFKLSSLTLPLCRLIAADEEDISKGFEKIAKKGHEQHPEIRDATDVVMEYYAEISQHHSLARAAFCGVGYVAEQLDCAWNRTRSLELDGAWKNTIDMLSDKDWQEFLDNTR